DLPDALDQGGPSAAGPGGRWRPRGLGIVRRVAFGFGAPAATLGVLRNLHITNVGSLLDLMV
ncbi:MAG: hypothetical protein V3T00_09580, partial [bacterium]